jgi:hypothetical protein
MKPIYKITVAVIILFLMSIAPQLVPDAQALRGRGAAFVVGAAVGSAASSPAPAPAPAPATQPQAAPAQPQAAPAQPPAK